MTSLSRRTVLASSLALAACGQEAASQPATVALKSAPFPIGMSAMTGHLQDEAWVRLARRHISQITHEWEMKMEYILQDDGSMRFDAPDAIVDFALANGMQVHGHTLVWYAERGALFDRLENDKPKFEEAYGRYITDVVRRYAGRIRSWDVVNEPVTDEGDSLRDCQWTRVLGEIDHAVKAFEYAAAADPNAVLFLNEYHLELKPNKRRTFIRMAEALLNRGVRLGGLGTQTHVDIDSEPGAITAAIRDLAQLGLPIHLSEMDIATHMKTIDIRGMDERLRAQARVAGEAAEAFMALPERQRFAFTLWGMRDSDSWLRGRNGTGPEDRPALFSENGDAKPAFAAVTSAFGL